jgi:hypothetical protein
MLPGKSDVGPTPSISADNSETHELDNIKESVNEIINLKLLQSEFRFGPRDQIATVAIIPGGDHNNGR